VTVVDVLYAIVGHEPQGCRAGCRCPGPGAYVATAGPALWLGGLLSVPFWFAASLVFVSDVLHPDDCGCSVCPKPGAGGIL
jgi:hypothetical protein